VSSHHSSADLVLVLLLVDGSSIQLELKIFIVIVFYVLNVLDVSEAEVVYLVREVNSVARLVDALNGFRVVMAADVEVAWHLVDEHEAR